MPPNSLAYKTEFEVLDKALEDEVGVRLAFASMSEAIAYRLRLHKARKLDRVGNKEIYDSTHELWGVSVYDVLVVRIKQEDSKFYCYVVRASTGAIEPLSAIPEREEEVLEPGPKAVAVSGLIRRF